MQELKNEKLSNKMQYAIRAAKKDVIGVLLRRAKSGEFKIECQDENALEIDPATAKANEKSWNAVMITPDHKIKFYAVKARQSLATINIDDWIA